ncbi:calaxin-like [Diadema antillarum]|uniref:calaxin-like n=2 Tax=Diadema TaxID=31174 RepID=UPI003A8778E2
MMKGNSKNVGGSLKDCHFTKEEQESLTKMFKELTKENIGSIREDKLDRSQFREVLHSTFKMTDDVMMDRILRAFDKDNDACINLYEWITGLSVFLKGTLDEKTQFCFKVFDLNGDGFIQREEMFHLLKTSMVKQPTEEDPEEGIKDLVEITIKKMDLDHDGRLSAKDFAESVKAEPLLVECFGDCLPKQKICDQFLEDCKKLMQLDLLYPETKLKYKSRRTKSRDSSSDCSSDEGGDEQERGPTRNRSRISTSGKH